LPDSSDWKQTSFNQNKTGVPSYNPFSPDQRPGQQKQDWARILGPVDETSDVGDYRHQKSLIADKAEINIQEVFAFRNRFAVALVNEELYLFDLHASQEKVYYHRFAERMKLHAAPTQQLLFPRTLDLNPARLHLFLELIDDFKALGFDMSHFGGHSVIINGLPPEVSGMDENMLIEKMLEDYEVTQGELKTDKHDRLALMMAKQAVRQNSGNLDKQSLEILIDSMFALPDRLLPFRNKAVAVKIGIDLIQEIFRKG
jgi:DNA mismatch repair protein MutL